MNLDLMRSRTALWAGAGVLAMAGAATSFAAAGTGATESPEEPSSTVAVISALQAQLEPQAFEPLQEEVIAPEASGEIPAETENGDVEALVLGVPEDSPACENNGCDEVVNAGDVTLHLPQPAVDGINRAAENRAAAQEDDGSEEPEEPVAPGDDAEAADEDAVRGVPADSPACEKHGCSEVETPGGVTVNVPQPAADGMARAEENRANAGNKGDDEGGDDSADTASTSASKGKPDWAGPPAGKGPNR